jgi:hypothetical protein
MYLYNVRQMLAVMPQGVGGIAILVYNILY